METEPGLTVTSRYPGCVTIKPITVTAVDGGVDVVEPNGRSLTTPDGYRLESLDNDGGVLTYRFRRHEPPQG